MREIACTLTLQEINKVSYINKRSGRWLPVSVQGNGPLKDIAYTIFKTFEILVFNGTGIYKSIKCIFYKCENNINNFQT